MRRWSKSHLAPPSSSDEMQCFIAGPTSSLPWTTSLPDSKSSSIGSRARPIGFRVCESGIHLDQSLGDWALALKGHVALGLWCPSGAEKAGLLRAVKRNGQ